jgi:hypothetical protein
MYKTILNLFFIINTVSGYTTVPSKFVKEAEIKHGRVAMASSLLIPLLDNVKPDTLGVNFVNSLEPSTQQLLLFGFGFSEFCQLLNAYEFPSNTDKWFKIKEDHIPGEYGFDPLELNKYNNSKSLSTNELFVGRVAMIAVTCQMVNELLLHEPVLNFS